MSFLPPRLEAQAHVHAQMWARAARSGRGHPVSTRLMAVSEEATWPTLDGSTSWPRIKSRVSTTSTPMKHSLGRAQQARTRNRKIGECSTTPAEAVMLQEIRDLMREDRTNHRSVELPDQAPNRPSHGRRGVSGLDPYPPSVRLAHDVASAALKALNGYHWCGGLYHPDSRSWRCPK